MLVCGSFEMDGIASYPSADLLVKTASDAFRKRFGKAPEVCGVAPGRVNLIGEHTDYNDGFVLPMALPMVAVIVGSAKEKGAQTSTVLTLSDEADDPKETEIDQRPTPGQPAWANYVKGVIANFGRSFPSFNAVVATSVPLGGGLSSSASLEVATCMFISQLVDDNENDDLRHVAKVCQKAEHEFANMPCGIMDQMVSCLARSGSALLLDCRSLDTDFVPLDDPDLVVLIANSHVRHTLTGSEYPSRRRSCEAAASSFGLKSLRDLTLDNLEAFRAKLDEETFKRAHHVVTEIQRTQQAGDALKARDYKLFGKLMNQSHESMRDDYEISCKEIDQLVEAAQSVSGVYGSRMTGGGFGGCTVTLVKNDAAKDAVAAMQRHFNGQPTFYICKPSAGCRRFKM